MTSANDDAEPRLEAAIAALLLMAERGQPVDIDSHVREYPELEDELREFWANHRSMSNEAVSGADSSTNHATLGPNAKTAIFTASDASASADKPRARDAADTDKALDQIGNYELFEVLGQGGMGVVFRGRDRRLGQQVAVKLLQAEPHDPSAVRRFYAEARATAQLSHPGIVPVFEIGEELGRHFYTMALVEGETLSALIERNGPMSPRGAAAIMKEAALTAEHAHQNGVVHRDIKPANIIIDRTGVPKLLDFGLAKREDSDLGLTLTGQILGTLAFMAPEQAAGRNSQIGPAADVYALGAALYCALTGTAPFDGESQAELIVKVLTTEPLAPSLPRADRALAKICMKCLEKSPEQRYESAAAFANDLDCYLTDEPVAASVSWTQRVRKWVRQRPSVAAHLGVLATVETMRHVKSLWGGAEPNDLEISGIFAIWAALCLVFQWMTRRWGDSVRTTWAIVDLGLLTWTLTLITNPHGPMLAAYPLLIVCCALLFRVRLVVVTTIGAIAGYLILNLVRPSDDPAHYHLLFVLMLAIFGIIVGAHLRRLRLLDEAYRGDV